MSFWHDLSDLNRIRKKKEKEKLDWGILLRSYKVFGRHYKKYWKILTVSVIALFATIGMEALAPLPLKLIVDHLILKEPLSGGLTILQPWFAGDSMQLLFWLSLSVIILATLTATISYINKFYISSTGDRMNADIRERAFAHLQRLSLSFHESARTGNIIFTLTSDLSKLKTILIDFPQDMLHRVGTMGTYATLMLLLDWRLGLIGIASMPVVYLVSRYFGIGLHYAMKKRRKREGNIAALVSENMSNMALVQAYGREDTWKARFNAENQQSLSAQLTSLKLQRAYNRVVDFLTILAMSLILYFGGTYALRGELLPGTLVLMTIYLKLMYGPIEKLTALFNDIIKSQVSAERMLDLVENEMIATDRADAVPAPVLKGKIEFRHVSFAYKSDAEVLRDVSFVVEPGRTIAVIGPSGAGKSTLVSLLLRFYDPQSGLVLLDDTDIRQYTLKSVREQITIVLQEARLFRQSVRENIAFGKPEASFEEIVRAAKLAEAHEFIMQMPQGYDTLMDEGGDNLSGGQKQRINIARAIIRDTPIIILDEPAAGLDARAEAKIHAAINKLTENRTTFIIAHNLSKIQHADRILLLDKGRISGYGAHQELLHANAKYKKLWSAQFGKLAANTNGDTQKAAGNGQLHTREEKTATS